jgi:Carboxypeptidase regulatory-like domain
MLLAGPFALLTLVACRNHIPLPQPDLRTDQATATISGTVRAPQRTTSADDRTVEIVNVETNERQRATTDPTGGFSFKLCPGRYRVKIALRDGEALIREPDVINITDKGVDAHADFIVGTGVGAGRVTRPRGPAYRIFDGLGHPIA